MRAGALRHRVDIQEQTSTPDGIGGFTTAWASKTGMGSVPARIMPLTSKEQLDAMKLESVVTNKIRIRYRAGITSADRMIFTQKSKTYNIKGAPINYDEKNRTLDFLVTEDI